MNWIHKYLDNFTSLDDVLEQQNTSEVTLSEISRIISRIIKKSDSAIINDEIRHGFNMMADLVQLSLQAQSVVFYFFDERLNIFQKEIARESGNSLPETLRINGPLINRLLITKNPATATAKDIDELALEKNSAAAGTVIELKGKVFGLLLIKTAAQDIDEVMIKALLDKAGNTIAHSLTALIDKYLERTKSHLFQAFFEINELISLHLDKTKIFDLLCSLFINIFECDRVIFTSFDLKTKKVKIERISGIPDVINENQIISGFSNIQLAVISTKSSIYIEDIRNDLAYGSRFLVDGIESANLKSLVITPIVTKGRVIGSFQLEYSGEGMIKENHLILLKRLSFIIGSVIEKVHLYKKMEEMATTDFLTGLLLKREFVKSVNNEINRSLRNRQPLSILMIDVDKFKNFNDTYGHLIGDEVLKTVSKVILNSIREIDIAARYAGDEFCVMLINNNSQQAMISAERIRKNVANIPVPVAGEQLTVTLSIGVATLSEQPKTFEELIHEADAAMYSGRRNGSRNIATAYSGDIKL